MRVMISQPMAGLKRDTIEARRAEAVEMLEAKGHEVVSSNVADEPPANSNEALWYLGRSLQIMATCDAVLFLEGWEHARGCRIERAACELYGVDSMHMFMFPIRSIGMGLDEFNSETLANRIFSMCVGYTLKDAKQAAKRLADMLEENIENRVL